MEFGNGRITGEGHDFIGGFILDGRYEPSGACHWTKTYVAAHDVFYAGQRQGKGISGIWEVDLIRGGFKIWPLGSGTGEDEVATESGGRPAEAVVS